MVVQEEYCSICQAGTKKKAKASMLSSAVGGKVPQRLLWGIKQQREQAHLKVDHLAINIFFAESSLHDDFPLVPCPLKQ